MFIVAEQTHHGRLRQPYNRTVAHGGCSCDAHRLLTHQASLAYKVTNRNDRLFIMFGEDRELNFAFLDRKDGIRWIALREDSPGLYGSEWWSLLRPLWPEAYRDLRSFMPLAPLAKGACCQETLISLPLSLTLAYHGNFLPLKSPRGRTSRPFFA